MNRVTRSLLNGVLVVSLILLWPGGAAPMALTAQAAPTRVRIGVTRDGIVQLTPADLAAAGVDPTSVDPRTFALSSMGQPVAIQVIGEADGRFDPEDLILFFGQKFRGTQFEEKYTDEQVYWLGIDGAAGPRIADVDAAPQGELTPPQDVAATVRAEVDTFWYPLGTTALVDVTQETWFWHELQPTPLKPVTVTLGYTVPDPAPGSAATFKLMMFAKYSNSRAQPEHRTIVTLNGAALLDQTWSGRWVRELTSAVPVDRLVSGLNSIEVSARATSGNYIDDVLVNDWQVDYRRLFRAWEGQFDFQAEGIGPQEYLVTHWASEHVALWDITDTAQPRRLVGATSELAGSGTQLRFRTDDREGSRYWLQEAIAFYRPATVRLRRDTGLRAPARGADTVIITPAEFHPAAERLAAWHEAHGRRAIVADLQDVYDEFNAGIAIAPQAVPKLLAWASTHWVAPKPAFLTLLGDGHYNIKGRNPGLYGTIPSWIPPYLVFVDPWLGEIAADMRYGDSDGDLAPDVAVGRLNVNTLADADTVVSKIVNYDETQRAEAWQQKALFISDNTDSAGDFPALSDRIIADYLPKDLVVTRAYLPGKIPEIPASEAEIVVTKQVISDTLQSGVWLVQYTGHGAPTYWASERILRHTDIYGLQNGDRLPIMMSFNCLDGFFVHPFVAWQGIAETMQRQKGGGAVAALAPTGDGLSSDQQRFREVLMTIMFRENVREIGTALDLAKRRYAAAGGAHYLIETMTLFGDPAMRLPVASGGPAPTSTSSATPSSTVTPLSTATPTPTTTATPTQSSPARHVYLPVVLR